MSSASPVDCCWAFGNKPRRSSEVRASLTGTAQVESRVTGLPAHLRRASVCAAKLSQAAPLPGEEGAGARGQTDGGCFHKICTSPIEAHSHSSLQKSAAWIERNDSPTLPLTRRQGTPLRPAAETGRPALTLRAESARFAQAETAVPGLCVASARGPHRQGPTRAGVVGGGSIGGWQVRRRRRPGPPPQSRRVRRLSHDGPVASVTTGPSPQSRVTTGPSPQSRRVQAERDKGRPRDARRPEPASTPTSPAPSPSESTRDAQVVGPRREGRPSDPHRRPAAVAAPRPGSGWEERRETAGCRIGGTRRGSLPPTNKTVINMSVESQGWPRRAEPLAFRPPGRKERLGDSANLAESRRPRAVPDSDGGRIAAGAGPGLIPQPRPAPAPRRRSDGLGWTRCC